MPPLATDENVEIAARALCSLDGVNPDAPTVAGEPLRVRGGYVVYGETRPCWHLYASVALAVLTAVEVAQE